MSTRKKKPLYGESDSPAWWKSLVGSTFFPDATYVGGDSPGRLAGNILLQSSMTGGPATYSLEWKTMVTKEFFTVLEEVMLGWDGRLVHKSISSSEPCSESWIWNSGAIELTVGRDQNDYIDDDDVTVDETVTHVKLEACSNVEQEIETIQELLRNFERRQVRVRTPLPAGQAYILTETRQGITLEEIGVAGIPLLRDNYSRQALKEFDGACGDMNDKSPRGRLTVLDGPPGTGKTYMVRAFMESVPESKFVIIPPHMVQRLVDPNLVLTFIRELYVGCRPIVLILEDADQCLSQRKAENMASISSILNLTDGIIGSLLDLRILATTNTPAQEFDAALLRKGRMSAHIKIGALSKDEIKVVWKNLAGPKLPVPTELLQGDRVLADVYATYNELSDVDKALGDIAKIPN